MSRELHTHSTQRGFSLVAAIFILVILAALGAFMITVGQVQRSTSVFAVQGARAFQAAQSGIEWGVFQVLNTPLGTMCSLAPATFTTGPFPLLGSGLVGFQTTVTCSYTQHQERSDTYEVFSITSTATFGTFGNSDYFSRTLMTTVTSAL